MRSGSLIFLLSLLIVPNITFAQTGLFDSDGDGLSDNDERTIYYTNWNNPDTDGDGFSDGQEISNGYSPLKGNKTKQADLDSDNDGLPDLWEMRLGTDIFKADNLESSSGKKEIVVDLDNLQMRLIQNNIVLEDIPVSTGRKGWETPRGDFSIKNKLDTKDYYGHPKVPYNLEFSSNHGWKVYIHSAPWNDSFGKKNLSTGCVNVPPDKMKEIYAWADLGTPVSVY